MASIMRGVVLLGLACMAQVAQAQARDADAWTFRLTPYVWGSSTDGSFAHARLPVDLHTSKSFSESLEDLDAGAMGAFEARKGRHGVLLDGQFAKLSTTVQVPVAGASLPVRLKTRSTSGLLAWRYGLLEREATQLDLVAGVRVWSARVRLAYAVPVPTPPPIPQQYAGEQSHRWVDAQVGVKGRHGFGNGFFVGGWVLAGAGESDLSTDLMLLAGYDIDERFSVIAGYRRLSTDFETSAGFRYDTTMQGPGLGIEYRF
ncbi:hypothetical protein [Pseudoxanthomonas sp.]|uniref:hypothetical protein n=1 Tax=Pseudoxanthomonas sp. TaxID=1871049 RepID=UPI002FE34BD5